MAKLNYLIVSGPVVIKNKKILLIKDKKDNFYKFPGGTVNPGENLEKACIRETKEEIGVDIQIIKQLKTMLLWKKTCRTRKIPVILVHYLAKIKSGQKIKPGKNIEEIIWLSKNKISKYNVAPNVKYFLKKLKKEKIVT